MILYRTDEYGNLSTSQSQKDRNGRDVYNDRKWSTTSPPESVTGKVNICLDGQWTVKEINSGTWYNIYNAQEKIVTDYEPSFNPENFTKLKPCEYPKWDGKKWIIDTEKKTADEEQKKISELHSIDTQSIRPLRAVLTAIQNKQTPDTADLKKLTQLENDAKNKRGTV